METSPIAEEVTEEQCLPIQLSVRCSTSMFTNMPVTFNRWATINYFVGPNGSGKTTMFNAVMEACRRQFPNKVKILGTGRLGPLEKTVTQWIGDPTSRLFQEENLENVYGQLFSGRDTSHEAFQILEKRLDLQIRVLGFLRHVFKKTLFFKSTRKGLQVVGALHDGTSYQIIDECHGLKELITILTFLYDDKFSVLGIDEPELHLHPQFQRFLLDELKAVAGDPTIQGKKLIFLVTHSPIFLEMRTISDLSRIIVFSHSSIPERTDPWRFSPEEKLKIRQALPSFHAGQREVLFSNIPFIVEGPSDLAIISNIATRLSLPLGAAGIGLTAMGGKNQLLAYRALLGSLAKTNARFILDLDAVVDTKAISCLENDNRVKAHLAANGMGDRTLTRIIGELIGLLREYLNNAYNSGVPIDPQFLPSAATERDLVVALRLIKQKMDSNNEEIFDLDRVHTILGKVELIRKAARAANVLILSRGSIEAYYECPKDPRASDFVKQQALQNELDTIWQQNTNDDLENRYTEILEFFREAGFLKVPVADQVLEPMADLIHLLQTEILKGRVHTLDAGRQCSRAKAEGYWDICQLVRLDIRDAHNFQGTLKVKDELGGEEINFDNNTHAYEKATRSGGRDGAQ
ncbi:MAG: ATP-dependent nuclease [Leptospirales bacterium]